MTNETSPRPWHEDNYCIYDANGKIVAGISSTTDNADALLIVSAVNEREAVRDALRDMEADAEAAWEGTPLRRVLVKHVTALREALAAALDHANECSRRADAERAGRARAVAEAQRDEVKETRVTFTFRDDGTWSTYCSANAESENMADVIACNVALYVGVAMNCMSEKELGKLVNKLQKVMVRDLKKRRAAK